MPENPLKRVLTAALAAAALLAAACHSLPSGEPPAGPIVELKPTEVLPGKGAAVNAMATAISVTYEPMAFSPNPVPIRVALPPGDGELVGLTVDLARQLVAMRIAAPPSADSEPPRHVLSGTLEPVSLADGAEAFRWTVRLTGVDKRIPEWENTLVFFP